MLGVEERDLGDRKMNQMAMKNREISMGTKMPLPPTPPMVACRKGRGSGAEVVRVASRGKAKVARIGERGIESGSYMVSISLYHTS